MARNPLTQLARLAARIDKLNADAAILAGRMLRSSRPETIERQSKAGQAIERRIRAAEKEFRQVERGLLRTTPGERRRAAERRRQELRREEESFARNLVAQTFTVRGSYRNKKNHGLAVEIVLTYVGLPILSTRAGDNKVRDAVRSLASGAHPAGWEVSTVEYGPTVERRVIRGVSELGNISAALNKMSDDNLHIEAGEHD